MSIKLARLKNTRKQNCSIEAYNAENARRVVHFHQSFPGYTPTPLARLSALAERLGVASLCVKDESKRFGLNAFKALGGSYAMGRYISEKLGLSEMDYAALTSDANRAKLGPQTFITATDGNHGRGIAWTANRIGQKCIVYMPAGTAAERLENIRKLDALGKAFVIRCPIIPGINDRKEHFDALARLYISLPSATGIQIMPYHRLGQGKTTRFGATSEEFRVPAPEEVTHWNLLLKDSITNYKEGGSICSTV